MQKDYFSAQAQQYQRYRPHYPPALYEFLLAGVPEGACILDCATGNGQAAAGLVEHANKLIGLDLSIEQLAKATRAENCLWIQSTVETLPIASHSIDLVTVAQALHWFDFEKFYPEVKRVLAPNGRIAVWTYSLLAACPQFPTPIEQAVRWFYHEVVGEFWPPERRWVDDEYQSIPFPFDEISVPAFNIDVCWRRQELVGYVSSWSAVQLYVASTGKNPLTALETRLDKIWPSENYQLQFAWPLSVRVGN